jgi:hypothetical protein
MIQKQSNHRRSGRAKKGAASPEFNKEHAHCFFDMMEIAHREFFPPNAMVNSDFYCDVLRRLRENVLRKIPEPDLTTDSFITKTRPPIRR